MKLNFIRYYFPVLIILLLYGSSLGAESQIPTGLVYVEDFTEPCKIRFWNLSSGESFTIVETDECPKEIFVSDKTGKIWVHNNKYITTINIKHQEKLKKNQLPDIALNNSQSGMKVIDAGLASNNDLMIVLQKINPADDTDNYLYRLKEGSWFLEKKLHCRRLEKCEIISKLSRSSDIGSWEDIHKVWHPRQGKLPFVIKMDSKSEFIRDYHVTYTSMTLQINNNISELSFSSFPGPDTDGILTTGLELIVNGNKTVLHDQGQCETALNGKYLLFHCFFDAGLQLINLETGGSELGNLVMAVWLLPKNK